MKIAFDAKRAFNNFTGLGNYARFTINALNKYYPDNELLLYTPTVQEHTESSAFLRKYNNQTIFPSGLYAKGILQNVWRSARIFNDATRQGANIFHGLSNELPSGNALSTKKIVTIHDLIFLRYPHFYPFIDRNIYKRKFKKACLLADKLIAVSEQTKHDIIEFFSIESDKIVVVYQGVHDNYKVEIGTQRMAHLSNEYGLHRPYLLYVGSIEERKNALQLVKAFKAFKRLNPTDESLLLIVGKKTKYQQAVEQEINESKLREDVRILNQVPFGNLPFLYKGAMAAIYPSSTEGFGIPILESLHMKTPVLAGNGAAMKEAGARHALYIEPHDIEQFAEKINQLVTDKDLTEKLLTGVDTHLAKFSANKIASDLMDVYQSVV